MRLGKLRAIPFDRGRGFAIEIDQDEDGRHARIAAKMAGFHANHGQRVAVATRDNLQMRVWSEGRMFGEQRVEAGDKRHHVVLRAPVERTRSVHVDLLVGEPFNAVRDAPCALVAQERGQLHAHPRVDMPLLREAVVVVRLGEVDERSVLLGARDGAGKVPFERRAVVCLEHLGICPVETGFGEQLVGDLQLAAKPLEHEDGVGVLGAHALDYLRPRLGWNHVSGVAAETVHALPAPEEEDVRHIGAELRMRVVELNEVFPRHAPRAGRYERAVFRVAVPAGVMGLKRSGPAGVVGGKVDEERAAPRMDCVRQLAELVEGRGVRVELRASGIYGKEVRCGERTAVAAHAREGGWHGEDRQQLDDAEPHVVHDVTELPLHVAECARWGNDTVSPRVEERLRLLHAGIGLRVPEARSAELAREHGVDRVGTARGRGRHLHAQVVACRPFGQILSLLEEARLAVEDAHSIQRDGAGKDARACLFHRHIVPFAAKVGTEYGAAGARRVERQRHGKFVAFPADKI